MGGDLPTFDEVDREFEDAASDIRKFRKERSQRQRARWIIAVVTAMVIMGGVAFLTRSLWLQELGSSQEVAVPSAPDVDSPDRDLPESDQRSKPNETPPPPAETTSPPESEGREVAQELQSALVVVAPFESVRLKLTRDDEVVKEWTMANKTETIQLPVGQYNLRQLSHLDRLKLDRTIVTIKPQATQIANLFHSGISAARETSEVVDVDGVPQKDIDNFIKEITPQLSASLTEDGKAVVVKGDSRRLNTTLGLYRDTIAVRSKRGLQIGEGPECQWFCASEHLLQFAELRFCQASQASLDEKIGDQLTSWSKIGSVQAVRSRVGVRVPACA